MAMKRKFANGDNWCNYVEGAEKKKEKTLLDFPGCC